MFSFYSIYIYIALIAALIGFRKKVNSSSPPIFLDEVQPSIAVISSDFDSQYGHPHDEVLERFADYGIETYWTGVHGTIVIRSDGQSLDVEPEVHETTDPTELLEMKPDDETDSMGIHPVTVMRGVA